jgi:hypothetical protein
VSTTGSASVAVDEDIENDRQPLQEPGLPTAPASTFVTKRAKSPPQLTTDADRSIVHHNDAFVGWHCREGSLDCSFCGSFFDSCICFWRLQIIPPLALYNSLKILNLLVNHEGEFF